MKFSIAKKYAQAFFDLCQTESMTAVVARELEGLVHLLDESSELTLFFNNPLIDSQRRRQVLQEIFKGQLTPPTLKFIDFLERRNRLFLLREIHQAFLKLLSEAKGAIHVKFTSRDSLDEALVRRLSERLGGRLSKAITSDVEVAPEIIGGIKLTIGNTVYDGSIRTQLERFKRRIVSPGS